MSSYLRFPTRCSAIVALATCSVFACFGPAATWAQLTPYSQDFESLNASDTSTAPLGGDGWLVGANVYFTDPSNYYGIGALDYNYFAFPAPNNGGAFSNVTSISNGDDPPNGNQGLVTYGDYQNADINGTTRRVESIFFREQTIGAGVGKTAKFTFTAQDDNLGGATKARAFVKTLDTSFNLVSLLAVDTTVVPGSGGETYSISLPLTPAQVGNVLQIGFDNITNDGDDSGVDYDDVSLTVEDTFGSYFEDFESNTTANQANADALSLSGWKAFGAVFDSGLNFKFQYGPFGSPNNPTAAVASDGFAGIGSAEAGAGGSTQYLTTYSDYDCCSGPEGHLNGTDIVDSSTFQEFMIGSADINRQVEFNFDAKLPSSGSLVFDDVNSDATFYIRTIDPTTGNPIAESVIDAGSLGLSTSSWSNHSVFFDINDPAWVGDLIQFGITSRSSNSSGTEILLDNVSFTDGVPAVDDADFDNSGLVDGLDFLIWQANFGAGGQTDNTMGDANGDGTVDSDDLAVWETQYGTSPLVANGAAVPEPSSLLLGIVSASLLTAMRRRREA